jgi:translation initiation factor 2B subunit (eIF-2B alpha/beta/delta family)
MSNTMNTTHYNIIDTLDFAFGHAKWVSICTQVYKIHEKFYKQDPELVLSAIDDIPELQGAGIQRAVSVTVYDCVQWAIENDLYGIV